MAETTGSTTVIAEDATSVDVAWDGERPIVDPAALTAIVGWELKPEGLCRDDVCVPLADRSAVEHADGIDLGAVAHALGRPVLVDADARMVAVGAPAADRQQALVGRQAPDATLLDLEGTQRRLSEWSGTRRLLVAFSSW
ncbi:MAG: hypothetical protein H8E59_00290 [Actinobacteria bacterium]|nr:hypothetical protein [Actinomycetota bacterium]